MDEDGRMPIKLPFKELGVDPNHYPQLRNSLKMLASIPVEIPYKTAEGRKYTKATNLCDVIFQKIVLIISMLFLNLIILWRRD